MGNEKFLAIYKVKFSHWRGVGEKKEEKYLHASEERSISDIEEWINSNFGGSDIEAPIIWELNFMGFTFSLDRNIYE